MCWIGTINNKRIAKRNITVYKVLNVRGTKNKVYHAPFRDAFTYKLGHLYRTDFMGIKNYGCVDIEINEGFHCYSQNAYAALGTIIEGLMRVYSSKRQYDVLHCFSRKLSSKPVVVKCTIPKGSTYYINNKGEIVTDNIILDRELGTPTNTAPLRLREIHKNFLFK